MNYQTIYLAGWLVSALVLPVCVVTYVYIKYYKKLNEAILNEKILPDKPDDSFLSLVLVGGLFGALWPLAFPVLLVGGLILLEEKGRELLLKKIEGKVVATNRALLLTSKDPRFRTLGETYPNRDKKKGGQQD